MNDRAGKSQGGLLVGGVVLIAFGFLFLLDEMRFADFGHVMRRFWPMVIVLVGLPKLADKETVWAGLWLLAVGTWLQIVNLGLFGWTYRNSWPVVLIALGAGIIVRTLFEAASRRGEAP